MKLIVVTMLLISSTAFAGRIVPNIKWNKIEFNGTGAAAALSDRNNATININQKDIENKNDSDDGYSDSSILGSTNISNDMMSLEAIHSRSTTKYDADVEDGEVTLTLLNLGKKINKIAVGATALYVDYDGGSQASFGLSGSYDLGKLLVGAGFQRNQIHGLDLAYTNFYTGVGFIRDNMAFEAVLTHQTSEEKDGISLDEETGFVVEGTITLSKFQISPSMTYETGENKESDTETKSLTLGFGAEYNINGVFFVGATLESATEEYNDTEDSDFDEERVTSELGVSLRYKKDAFQVIASTSTSTDTTEYSDGADDNELKATDLSLTGTYFF